MQVIIISISCVTRTMTLLITSTWCLCFLGHIIQWATLEEEVREREREREILPGRASVCVPSLGHIPQLVLRMASTSPCPLLLLFTSGCFQKSIFIPFILPTSLQLFLNHMYSNNTFECAISFSSRAK